MKPQTIVENNLSGLEMVINALTELSEDRFIEGIRLKHHTTYEILQTNEMVKMYQNRVNVEIISLVKFSETFIRQFATENNNCYDTAQKLFGKIRSTIACLKKIYSKTTATSYVQLPTDVQPPSVFKKSSFNANTPITPDIFGLTSFDGAVQQLYSSIETLFTSSSAALALCRQMIENEAKTRDDVELLRQIFDESCRELLTTVRGISLYISSAAEIPQNELQKRREKAGKNVAKFLQEEYHKHHKQELVQYVMVKHIREGKNDGLTDLESILWAHDHDKAKQVRSIIDHLDELEGIEGNPGKFSSRPIVELIKWSGVLEKDEKRFHEEYLRNKYKGKYKLLGWNSISQERKLLKDNGATREMLARDFATRLAELNNQSDVATPQPCPE